MKPAADIIRSLLVSLNIGRSAGGPWQVFVGWLPDLPNDAICVYDTAGTNDGRVMAGGERIEHPGIQVRVRGTHYVDARNKSEEIALALDAQYRIIVPSDPEESESVEYEIQNITRTGTILPMGAEESDKRRFHFTINAITTIKEKE